MAEPIRVLHVFGRLDRGGAESRTMDIYRNIDRTRIQFDFIGHTNEKCAFDDEITSLGGYIHRLPRFVGLNWFTYRQAWRDFLADHDEYRIIHIHVLTFAFAFASLLKRIPMRIMHARSASDHSMGKRVVMMFFRPITLAQGTHFMAVSEAAANFMFGRRPVTVVPNAINARAFAYNQSTRDQVRRELGLQGAYTVGHVGRFSDEKNHKYLLSIFDIVQRMHPEAILLLVGDGELRPDMEQKASSKGINVRFLGVREDVQRLMQAMDVFVLPSLFEGMPGSAIEAQAAGLPCIISDNVTEECAIIPSLVTFLPIGSLNTKKWAHAIQKTYIIKREDTFERVKSLGFDAKTQALWYMEFYEKELAKCAESQK